ncbi:hypothetical protein KKF04_05905 [Patescibacteria group bacterium]|nr:hypothetical protein [Patescibacteria group bacterium]
MLQPLTTSEMQAFEKFACDNFDITVDDMMQSAGKAIFDLVVNEIKPKRVLVVAGKGNNGGDALVAVRLLKEEGVGVEILSPYSDDDSEGAIGQSRLRDIEFDLIIDALLGFHLKAIHVLLQMRLLIK